MIGSCTKLDTTTIGGDLIPAIDNVNTFADTLDIITTQGVFDQSLDSTRLDVSENFVVGHIQDDQHLRPLGTSSTDAKLYLQMRPAFYPFYIGLPKDTIMKADSVVLCLSYKGFGGDSTQPLHLKVFNIGTQGAIIPNYWDSVYQNNTINYAPQSTQVLIGNKAIDIRTLGNYTKVGLRDSVNYQIRIKLSDAFRDELFSRDSLTNSFKNAFYSDSLFRLFNNGFAIEASLTDNALVYTDLFNDGKTRLELHYSKRSKNANDTGYAAKIDTVFSAFYFNPGYAGLSVRKSAVANKITRTHPSLPSGAQELYLQTTPGTFANLEIPQLDSLSKFYKDTLMNSVINRAEIEIQQIPDASYDNVFNAPNYMYLDLVDSGANKWKPIYYDLNPASSYDPDYKTPNSFDFFPYLGSVDFTYFGGYLRKRIDLTGVEQSYYNFNITRYLQRLVTQHARNYKLRIFPAHNFSYPQYNASRVFSYPNTIAFGSVKVGGGNNTNAKYRMRLRIVYTKIK